jgi:ABC-type phosphate/phosphonate transport system permease subunit
MKRFASLTLLFLTLSVASSVLIASAEKSPELKQEQKISQEKTSLENQSSLDTTGSKGFVEISQKDGSKHLAPVITGRIFQTIVLTAMYGAVVLLVVILLLAFFASKNLEQGRKTQYLSEALPSAIEGITIIYIVVAVLLLATIGIASAEGCLSILSAISGYVLGKNQGKRLSGSLLVNSNDRMDENSPNNYIERRQESDNKTSE